MPAAVVGSGVKAAIVRYNLLFLFTYALAFLGAYLLAREKVRAEERERVREQEEQVVTDDRGLHARADDGRRHVAEQRIRERERVGPWPGPVRLGRVERLGGVRGPPTPPARPCGRGRPGPRRCACRGGPAAASSSPG